MGTLSTKFLDTLRKHLEIGTSLRHINMSEEQKQRVRICMELYNLLKQNPYMNKEEYLKNKYNRTYWEIRNDKECLDFIISVLDAGGKNISRFMVKTTYEKAIKMAHDKGNEKEMISAAKHLSDLEKLTEPEQGEDLENSITKLPIVLTQDARKILPGKSYSNSAQMDRLRKKWGVQKDPHQAMVEQKAEELQQKMGEEEKEGKTLCGINIDNLSPREMMELADFIQARMDGWKSPFHRDTYEMAKKMVPEEFLDEEDEE